MDISLKLKAFRTEASLSQHELARASGVSQQLISQIENGKNASTKHLHKLARALGKKLTDFDPGLTDVLPGAAFAQRYENLDADAQLALQALLARLERGGREEP